MKWPIVATVALLLLAGVLAWLWTPDLDRATLQARYLRAPGDLVDVAGVRLHVRDSGPRQAPVLILLHGFGASLHTWDAWAEALSKDRRVIRLDWPGSGLSAPDPTGDYSDARSQQLLLALMDARGVARASVLGHSIGGRIAWAFAAHHPGRVDQLVLLAPDGFASPGFEYGKKPALPAVMSWLRYALPYALPRAALRQSLLPAYADPATLSDAMTARYHDLMRAPGGRDALLQRLAQAVLVDPVPWLRRIQAPTLLLWGERDAMIPVANAADYLAALPHATRVVLPGVGHLPQEERPALGLAAVQGFLRPVPAPPGAPI